MAGFDCLYASRTIRTRRCLKILRPRQSGFNPAVSIDGTMDQFAGSPCFREQKHCWDAAAIPRLDDMPEELVVRQLP